MSNPAPLRPESSDSIAMERKRRWYLVMSQYPFYFLPITAIIGIICSIVMPYLTGVSDY